jgi:hypothetical protein
MDYIGVSGVRPKSGRNPDTRPATGHGALELADP